MGLRHKVQEKMNCVGNEGMSLLCVYLSLCTALANVQCVLKRNTPVSLSKGRLCHNVSSTPFGDPLSR